MSETPDDSEKPDLHIDEGWKAQVEAERDALRQKEQEAEPEEAKSEEAETAEEPSPAEESPESEFGPMPPASLSLLITTLATQAMVSMGLMPDPLSRKAEVRLDQAKHFIDTLEILQEKTEGNRTAEETQVLDGLLHELRMGFVAVKQHGQGEKPA